MSFGEDYYDPSLDLDPGMFGSGDPGGGSGFDPSGGYYSPEESYNPGYGMGDRGLGTGGDGTLTAEQIAGLSPGMDMSGLTKLAKLFGMTNKDGSVNLGSLLPLLGMLGGGIYGINQQGKATNQMQDAIAKSNDIITQQLGGSSKLYDPYRTAGLDALTKIQNLPPSNLAGNFKPLGSGRGMTLSQLSGRR